MSHRLLTVTLAAMLIAVLGAPAADAVTAQIQGGRDTMILSDSDSLSNGAGTYFCVGRTGQPATRRGLVWFDISAIPVGSTITSATLDLYLSPPSNANNATVDVHRLTQDWGEGTSNAPDGECKGTSATNNDATWRYRFYSTANPAGAPQWTTLGGAFLATPSASRSVGTASGHYLWTSAGLAADVQAWVGGTASNFGLLVKRNTEIGTGNAVRFSSRSDGTASRRPVLTVNYDPPPVSGACCFPAQKCQELTATDCGNQGGSFLGEGTDCIPNVCPPDVTGACCAANGICTEVSELACNAGGNAYQGDGTTCLDAQCPILLEPFVDPLPLPAVAQPVSGSPGGAASYELTIREQQQQLHRDLPPTTVWGVGDGPLSGYPGPTIEARTNVPVTITWSNELRDTSVPGEPKPYRTDHYLAVDGTAMPPACHIHGAEDLPKTVMHLHGGHVPAAYDGYPESTYLPGEQAVYHYPNNQQAGTLWYHDHALGITRLNVYMGLAGFYLVRDDFEDALDLPACPDPAVRETCYEIPLAIQDRSFNPDGTLRYPEMWHDHFFGDKMLVNGKVWPYLDVKQGKYRLRLLDGCTSRTLALSLDRLDVAGEQDLPFVQIGTDGGLMELPVLRDTITLSPGERADVIVDFELLPPGTEVVLRNRAPAPYPGSPGVGVVSDVMKFVVQDAAGQTDPLPAALRPQETLDELSAIKTRDFVLAKEADACGSVWKINGLGWENVTEYPQLGTTEIWRFINEGNTMHPMHMHLAMFQVLDRQPIGGGAPVPPEDNELGWKDTARAEADMITRVIARFEDYSGYFAYHCHILEHEDHEMMRKFQAVEAVELTVDPGSLGWGAQPGAASYDVVRGDLSALRTSSGNFAIGTVTTQCLVNDTASTSLADAATPDPDDGYWYLVRSTDGLGIAGSYDSGSSFQVDLRDDEIAASGNGCP